jgi:AAA15 family ATPase/GTPase
MDELHNSLHPKLVAYLDRPFNLSIAEKIVANDSLFNCTAVDKNNELSLVLSCQIFFLPLSALIVTAEEAKISDEMKELLVKKGEDLSKIKLFKVEFQHTSDDGSVVSFDFREQESKGTQRLFKLSGPWLEVLEKGYCLVMDELHNSLHPKLVAYLCCFLRYNKILNTYISCFHKF